MQQATEDDDDAGLVDMSISLRSRATVHPGHGTYLNDEEDDGVLGIKV